MPRVKHDTAYAIARLFHDRQAYFDSTYTHMSIENMKKSLKEAFGVTACIRTIKYHLSRFEGAGMIKTFPSKWGRKADGTLFTIPPNRSMTLVFAKWLRSQSFVIVKWLWDHLTGKQTHRRVKSLDEKHVKIRRETVAPKSTAELSKLADSLLESFR